MIRPLPNPDFFKELTKQLKAARHHITIVNYLAELEPRRWHLFNPMQELSDLLIEKRKRGVEVIVYLEGSKFEVNYPFYRKLKDHHIDVWMDTSQTFIHHKIVLIDDRLIFVGSHNLTNPSLLEGEESSVVTSDRSTVLRFIKEIEKISIQKKIMRGMASSDVIPLPKGFLTDLVAPLFRSHAEKSFDLYLQLCLKDRGAPKELPIQPEKWCRAIGIPEPLKTKKITPAYQKYHDDQRLNRLLYPLAKRYRAIVIDRKKDTVKRLPLPHTEGPTLSLPTNYWRYGWGTRLSFSAKYFYLISLTETMGSLYYPWWKRSLREIAMRYQCHLGISQGARELADMGLIERLTAVPVRFGQNYSEEATFYRCNPFYDLPVFERQLERLGKKFSRTQVTAAQGVARIFWQSHDLGVIEKILGLIRDHGVARIVAQSRLMARLPKESSRRSFNYLAQIVSSK